MSTKKPPLIYHIVSKSEWETAVRQNQHTPASLEDEGFIHCSTKEQLLIPANAFYRGQTGLILLQIDPKKVTHEVVFEDCYESGTAFPHIYGPLNVDAVVQMIPFPPQADGSFVLPDELP